MIRIIFLVTVFTFTSYSAIASELYSFSNLEQKAQFDRLTYELRCLVCQNQNLADSNAPLAKDLRDEIYRKIKLGQSEQEILHYVTQRYGDFVLYNPPWRWYTSILWLVPLIGLVWGGWYVRRRGWKR